MKLNSSKLEEIKNKYRLSPREFQILLLILDGVDSNKEIAKHLGVTLLSAKRYVHDLFAKVGVSSKLKLATKVYKEFIK